MQKKRPARSRVKNPGLKKHYHSRIRQEYFDYDYIDKLSEKEKEWLNSFTEEELAANFNHKGKKLNKTKAQKRKKYNENNARNRCIYSNKRAAGYLGSLDDSAEEIENMQNVHISEEDAWIIRLDEGLEEED